MSLIALALLAADVCTSGAEAARQRDLAKARALLEQCVKLPPATLESFLLLAGVHQAGGDEAALYATAQSAIRRFPEEKRFYLAAATYAGRRKQYADAIRIMEPALKRWPDDAGVRALTANALFGRGTELLDAGDHVNAAALLRRSAVLAPNDVDAHMNLGRALHNTGRYAEALAAFDRVQALKPEYPLLAFHRGLSLHYMGEFEKAVDELSRVKDYVPAQLVRGLALLSRGSSTEAASELRSAAAALPDDPAAQFGYARTLVRLGKLAEAEPYLRRTLDLDKADPAPANLLVMVLRKLEREDEARKMAVIAAERMKQQRSARPGEIQYQGTKQ